MEFSSAEIAEAFYQENIDVLGHLTLEEVKLIIHTPYRYMKDVCILGNKLPQMRLKYLGTFQPTVYRCITQQKRNTGLVMCGYITEDELQERHRDLQVFIDENK